MNTQTVFFVFYDTIVWRIINLKKKMKIYLLVCLISFNLINLGHSGSLIEDTQANVRKGLPKLLKVLNWLVLEKDDSDSLKMSISSAEKFVDFVMARDDMCVPKSNGDVTCEALRKEIDAHKQEAGTEGIDFDAKMKSIGKILGRFFGAHDADTVKPYGVMVLLEWALEFGNSVHTRIQSNTPKPKDLEALKALVKFIVTNKDFFWATIQQGIEMGQQKGTKPDVTPMQTFIMENLAEMGWVDEKPTEDQIRASLVILAADYGLMEKWGKSIF
ncbi:uncharacterized protein LOC141855531 [Brevipalpus obovatus]|uniref:uncharacterized protein LOC141855531 n=1 Tax=Brevipalpus obovatus TaxID=246614 RepID=UPI003D9F5584